MSDGLFDCLHILTFYFIFTIRINSFISLYLPIIIK